MTKEEMNATWEFLATKYFDSDVPYDEQEPVVLTNATLDSDLAEIGILDPNLVNGARALARNAIRYALNDHARTEGTPRLQIVSIGHHNGDWCTEIAGINKSFQTEFRNRLQSSKNYFGRANKVLGELEVLVENDHVDPRVIAEMRAQVAMFRAVQRSVVGYLNEVSRGMLGDDSN